MILAHALVGVAAGTYFNDMSYILLGSVFPDIDHLIVIIKNKSYRAMPELIKSLKTDGKFGLKYKTKYVHSIFGSVLFSVPLLLWNPEGARNFFFAYLGHLVLDWFDHDEKQYLFPLQKKFKGFLPIFSRTEIVFTVGLIILMVEVVRKY